jgi:predicted nucleic-acid-binding protein
VKITPDTNVLVRALARDDEHQFQIAAAELQNAATVVLTMPALCELAWVLSHRYRFRRPDIAAAIAVLAEGDNVAVEAASLEAGLAMLHAGGDFADGVIARQGRDAGAEVFVSFDKDAIRLLRTADETARLLA